MKIIIECSDEADAEALKNRLEQYLKVLDNGDYSGRIIEVKED